MAMRKGLPAKLALTDADDTRYDFRNLVVSNADGTPRGGLTAPVGTNVITGSATMNVSVGAFAADAVRDGGVILLANDGPVNVLLDAAPVSNSRWDLICARQDDASSTVTTPDADNLAKLYFVKGTAASTPTAPALPAGSVEVGRVLVSAGNTNTNSATIKQADVYTAGAGGVVPFRTLAALQLWTTAQPQQLALVVGDTTKNGLYQWGTAWTGLTVQTPSTVTLSPPAGVTYASSGSSPVEAVAVAGRMFLGGTLTSSSATFVAGTPYSLGSVPAGVAPATTQILVCSTNSTAVAAITIDSSGNMTFRVNTGFTGALALALGGSWRMK